MGFFNNVSSPECSRRSFLKGLFGVTVVAVAVPKCLASSEHYIVKFENRFIPGKFVYVEYGKNYPIRVIPENEIQEMVISEEISWDSSEEALEKRGEFLKEIMKCMLDPTKNSSTNK